MLFHLISFLNLNAMENIRAERQLLSPVMDQRFVKDEFGIPCFSCKSVIEAPTDVYVVRFEATPLQVRAWIREAMSRRGETLANCSVDADSIHAWSSQWEIYAGPWAPLTDLRDLPEFVVFNARPPAIRYEDLVAEPFLRGNSTRPGLLPAPPNFVIPGSTRVQKNGYRMWSLIIASREQA